jgi:hypothetical protein
MKKRMALRLSSANGRTGWGAFHLEGSRLGEREVGTMTESMIWKCEQWVGGSIKEQNLFRSEEAAREFARALAGISPDLIFKIEPMPLQHVWN